jgi:hypothetical protein
MSVRAGPRNLSLYEDDRALTARAAPFLQAGLDAGEAVNVVVDQRKWVLLRGLLGPAAERIAYDDRDAFCTRPEKALAAYDARVRHLVRAGAPSVRVWAEFPVFARRARRTR